MKILLISWAAVFLLACGDDHFTTVAPALKDGIPKKCLDDPCLPGCPSHDFLCEDEDDEG